MKKFFYIIFILTLIINTTSCIKKEEAIENTIIKNTYDGISPFKNFSEIEKIDIANYNFHDVSFYVDKSELMVDKEYPEEEKYILPIYPLSIENSSFNITISKEIPDYYYKDYKDDNSQMAAIAIEKYINDEKSDNQFIIESLFKEKINGLNAYGVLFEIENFYKSVYICFVYKNNIYHFQYFDKNNNEEITKADGFNVFLKLIASITMKTN